MSTSLLNPSYVDLLPPQFKRVRNESSAEALAKYDLDLVLLTAYLLEQVDKTYVRFNNSNLDQFRRTRRFDDLFPNSDNLSIKDIELFKGYLLFKGTSSDLVLSLRQIGLDATIVEKVQSGIIDDVFGVGLYNNTTSNFKFSNDTNDTKFGQSVAYQDLSGLCKIGLTINVNLSDSQITDIVDTYGTLSRLLVNRLHVCTSIDEITLKYRLKDSASNINPSDSKLDITIGVVLADNTFATISFNNTSPNKFNNTAPFDYERGLVDTLDVSELILVQ